MLLVSEVRTRAHSCDGMPQLRGRCREMMMGHEVDDPFTWVELDALVSDLLEVRREIAAAEARQARILSAAVDLVADRTAALHRRDPGRLAGADLPLREVCAELAAATRMSDRAVQRRMGDAASVVKDYPQVLEAWSAGHIDAGHVTAILDAGIGMDAGTRAEYEQVVLDAATHETAGRMRTIARTIAARVDPDGEARRTATARADRYIRVIDLPDGMARLLADLPATLAHAIYDRLTGMARTILDDHDRHRAVAESVDAGMASGAGDPAAAADAGPTAPAPAGDPPAAADPAPAASPTPAAPAGSAASATPGDPAVPAFDPRTPGTGQPAGTTRVITGPTPEHGWRMDQVRADLLTDLLLAATPVAHGDGLDTITGHVQITVPALTLAGTSNEPALLAGYGPIDPDTARRLAAGAPGWDRVLTHPHTGAVLAVDRYRPSADLIRHLRARDERCRYPGCSRHARGCDIDHTRDAAHGGPTQADNLAHLCRRHHTLKHHTRWKVRRLPDSTLEWTGPTGRRYHDRPPATVAFVPTPPTEPTEPAEPPPF